MKRIICLVLLILLLCGCSKEDMATFYYRPVDYLTDHNGPVLSAETRNITGYTENPHFLVSLYLTGPLDKDLQSPFPKGTRLQSLINKDRQLTVQLYDLPQNLSDAEFSLACACLTMTCMEFFDVDSVTIICGNRSVSMDQSILTLSDSPTTIQSSDGGTS